MCTLWEVALYIQVTITIKPVNEENLLCAFMYHLYTGWNYMHYSLNGENVSAL